MTVKRIAAAFFSLIVVSVGGALAYVSLVLLDPERIKPFLLEQVQNATGRTLIVEGEFTPTLSLSPTLAVEKVSLGNADWGKAEKLFTADRLEISFSLLPLLSGQFSVQSLSLEGANLWLEQKGNQRNWELSAAKTEEAAGDQGDAPKASGSAFAIDAIDIRDSNLHYANLSSGESQALAIETLSASDLRANRIEQASLKGRWNTLALSANASLTDGVLQLKANADSGASKADINGSLSLTDQVFDARLNLDSSRIADLVSLSGSESSNNTPLTLSANLGGTPSLINITKLDLTYDAHAFTATGKLDRSGETPAFTGAITADTLNLKGKAGPAAAANDAGAGEAGTPATIIPRDPLPFDALGALNADVAIKIAKVEMDKGGFTDVSAKLALQNRKLTLSDLSAKKADGSLSGSLVANAQANPPAVSLQLATQKLTLGALMKELSGADSVEGGNMTAKLLLNGSGASLHDILASASGSYDMLIEQATYTPPSGVQDASRFFDVLRGSTGSGPVDITCSVAQFGIEGGVATSKVLAVQSPNALVSGDGNVNLGKETLRFELKARSTVLGFADVVPPLVISGGWNNPSVGLSAQSALLSIGKFALGAATGVGLVAVVGEQFTDKLGITADNNPCLKSIEEAAEKAKAADSDPKAAIKASEQEYLKNRDAIKDNVKGAIEGGEQEIKNIEEGIKGLRGILGQ